MAVRHPVRPPSRVVRLAYHLGLGPLVIAARPTRTASAPRREPRVAEGRTRLVV